MKYRVNEKFLWTGREILSDEKTYKLVVEGEFEDETRSKCMNFTGKELQRLEKLMSDELDEPLNPPLFKDALKEMRCTMCWDKVDWLCSYRWCEVCHKKITDMMDGRG